VRADALDRLTEHGWAALEAHGVRTVIDLREDDEHRGDAARRPASVTTVRLALDGRADRQFWDAWDSGPQFGTPLYYRPHLDRMPERSVAVLSAIATAPAGGVAYHCGGGRDRAGQVTMLALALAGVEVEEIVADYELSEARLAARAAATGDEDQGPVLAAYLAERGTTAGEVLRDTLSELDVRATLAAAGLSDAEAAGLRARLLDP
jgi:hypothetical protein